jgi:hypothetical protein
MEGLGRTGGPPNADIGVNLHLETKDLGYGKFFDRDNATIGLL